jgi:hypothetical protein
VGAGCVFLSKQISIQKQDKMYSIVLIGISVRQTSAEFLNSETAVFCPPIMAVRSIDYFKKNLFRISNNRENNFLELFADRKIWIRNKNNV